MNPNGLRSAAREVENLVGSSVPATSGAHFSLGLWKEGVSGDVQRGARALEIRLRCLQVRVCFESLNQQLVESLIMIEAPPVIGWLRARFDRRRHRAKGAVGAG